MGEYSKTHQWLVVGVLVVGAIYLLLFMPLRSTAPLIISRAAATNDPVAGPVSVFTVSNTSGFAIRLWTFPPQTNSSTGWRQMTFGGVSPMIPLPAHSVYTFKLAKGPEHVLWRMPVGWDYDQLYRIEFARRFLMDNITQNLRRLSQGQSPGINGGNHTQIHPAYSPEFSD